MAAIVTKINDLVNTEVLSDLVNTGLEGEITLAPLAAVDASLVGQAGDTVKLPKYAYIGDAEDVAEGEAVDITKLCAVSESVTVKKAGKGIEITDEAALSGYGDPIGEGANQLRRAIAQKVDGDCYDALCGIGGAMTVGDGTDELTADFVADALVKFGQELGGDKVLLIAPKQLAALRKDDGYIMPCDMGAKVMADGTVGSIHGCQVVISDRIAAEDGVFTNFIVKAGALAIFLKRDTNVETDRNIVNKTTVITADKHYAAYLADESKAVKLTTAEA
ncbi:MAG: N4-gp56 family major capsid protein [Clostridiales bacterium]|jgi:N4-gp56 family major capsid protein|nr:N4-gp56 family major capsid protein [Clostridiales bacterium]